MKVPVAITTTLANSLPACACKSFFLWGSHTDDIDSFIVPHVHDEKTAT